MNDRLAPWRSAPGSAGVLTDFDGTLAPIVDDPEAARPLDGVAPVLARLGLQYRVVAVVSGRPVAYLFDRLGSPQGVTLVGLYGLEKGASGAIEVAPDAARWRGTVAEVAEAAEREAPPGVYVERKGLTVGLHVRRAPEHAGWIAAWAEQQASRTGLVVRSGRMTQELLPPIDTDKGAVATGLARDLRAVCYVGDDVADLAAFAALSRMAKRGVATLSVAVRSAEVPAALLDQADMVVDGPEGALGFLTRLATLSDPDDGDRGR